MGTVYVINNDGSTTPMEKVHCKNEDRELQTILERNPDLLPGDQIDPEDPRRWLLVKREMPVQDPSTGGDRWSLDFFFVDQSAMPTLVECKRYADTRSRREVVGQVLEYAANGHYYWTKEMIRQYAEASSQERHISLEEAVRSLRPDFDDPLDAFLDRVVDNLREGQVRLVFFLEEAPIELKSVVDFLNRQMERSEVLLVEARQHRHAGVTVVAPRLFGYTEQARAAKRPVIRPPGKWNLDSFLNDAKKRMDPQAVVTIRKFYLGLVDLRLEIGWGTGRVTGSFSPRFSPDFPKSFLTVWSHGGLTLNFGWLTGDPQVEAFRDRFRQAVKERLPLPMPADDSDDWPAFSFQQWAACAETLTGILRELLPGGSSPLA